MPGPTAALSARGERLHLQHGPIDLVIGADAESPALRSLAFGAARRRFEPLLQELVAELPLLRSASGPKPSPVTGAVAQRMARAVTPHAGRVFVTPMAAVAGAVADEILAAMLDATPLRRAYVNNGGDIALHLADGQRFRMAIASLDGTALGRIDLAAGQAVGGLATSGLGGRSLTRGIARSVTVLADTAAAADAAATLIANAVDLPGHPAIQRCPARQLVPESDLGDLPVVVGCGPLTAPEVELALASGADTAQQMLDCGLIRAAILFLRGRSRLVCPADLALTISERTLEDA